MAHRMTQLKPEHCYTKAEVDRLIKDAIDDAMRKHNRNASIISFFVGWIVLALFSEGLLRLLGIIPPLTPWLDLSLK